MKNNKGFTLIELLVVIAIIGILSSVVLASLTTARTRGQSASVQSQLSNMRAQAELYYSTNGNKYSTAAITSCTDTDESVFIGTNNGLVALLNGVKTITTVNCGAPADGSAWAVSTNALVGGQAYCVDSTGVSTTTAAVIDQTAINDGKCL